MNTGFHVSFSIVVPQDICPVVRLLGRMVVLFLVFKGSSILFSIVALSICIPTKRTLQYKKKKKKNKVIETILENYIKILSS